MAEHPEKLLWDKFLQVWPKTRVKTMTLEEYTTQGSKDCLCWWLEYGLKRFGKMGGVSAFKFGVYARKDVKEKSSSTQTWEGKYAFENKFGITAEQAYATIHKHILTVIDAVEREDLKTIEEVPLARTLKWKLALLFQNQQKPVVFAIFTHEALFENYKLIEPTAVPAKTPQHVMYKKLLEHSKQNIFDLADHLWQVSEATKDKKKEDTMQATGDTSATRYYKIAPGEGAQIWDTWQQKGIATIGWKGFGDLSQFDPKKVHKLPEAAEYNPMDARQAALFHQIRVGDIIVANHGKSRVVGIGTVISPYAFVPGEVSVKGGDHPHRIGVDWHSAAAFDVNEPSWFVTILALSQAKFEEILARSKNLPSQVRTATESVQQPEPTNVILYGPPGSGKTYKTKERALRMIQAPELNQALSPTKLNATFQQYLAEGRINFVTFHQSFGYEDFVEGIRPNVSGDGNNVQYKHHQGTFKRLALLAAFEGLKDNTLLSSFNSLWAHLVRRLEQEGPQQVASQKNYRYILSYNGENRIKVSSADPGAQADNLADSIKDPEAAQEIRKANKASNASKTLTEILWRSRAKFGENLEHYTYKKTKQIFETSGRRKGGHNYTEYFLVYNELHKLSQNQLATAYSDETKIAMTCDALNQKDWPDKFSFSDNTKKYVLIIDEINRGNVSKIFGELITLIEESKRLTKIDGLVLPLTHSQDQRFGVPPNLHIIGTMNTSDRSIALIDIALRRRFEFEAQMPDVRLLEEHLKAAGCDKSLRNLTLRLLDIINRRITFLYDADHQLGHAMFFSVKTISGLCNVFIRHVVPLLLEYFYGSWDKVCAVLGCGYDDEGAPVRQSEAYLLDKTKEGDAAPARYLQPFITAERVAGKDLGLADDEYESILIYNFDSDLLLSLPPNSICQLLLGVLKCANKAEYDQLYASLMQNTLETTSPEET